MEFCQIRVLLACFVFSFLSSTLHAEAVVVYEGPAVIHESEPFSLSCFTNLFATLKWRQNDSSAEFDSSDNYLQSQSRTETLQFNNLTILNTTISKHSGNYKCSYDSDDFGHNLTVIFDSKDSLEVNYEGSPCQQGSTTASLCVLGVMYEKLTLKCRSTSGLHSNNTLTWYKKGKTSTNQATEKWDLVTESNRIKFPSIGEVHFLQLSPDDIGHYVCRITLKGQESMDTAPLSQRQLEVRALPLVVPAFKDLTVVEENTINLTCTVIGKATRIIWKFGDTTLVNGSNGRVELREFNGVQDATLLIKNANTTTDRGHYNCTAESEWGSSKNSGVCYVRVKGKYAALAPFLGICAEVVILCTIILIYEKKRDKTELEESDTDQGPETKNSPDHGQDSVRYRK